MAINVNVQNGLGNSNIRVNTTHTARVKLSNSPGITNARVSENLGFNPVRFTTNANPIVIRNEALLSASNLRDLHDVVMLDKADGNTLVYNAADATFILETPDHLNLNIANIDGGSF
jgi:hypothetical protein